ncbi:hypothetical protein BN1723_020891, partial [Verticillium longisporum]
QRWPRSRIRHQQDLRNLEDPDLL